MNNCVDANASVMFQLTTTSYENLNHYNFS